jgi:ammonium transporter, Amt family
MRSSLTATHTWCSPVAAASPRLSPQTPGVAFFYGGMVRRTSLISTLLQSFVIMGLVLILWVIIGFSLAFGEDWGGSQILGNPSTYYFWRNVGGAPNPE